MSIRRASHQFGIDPRSPIALSIPQHNLISSFHSISQSPMGYKAVPNNSPYTANSPHPFAFKNPTPTPSPISTPQRLFSFYEAFPTANPPRLQAFTQGQSQLESQFSAPQTPPPAPRKPSSSLKFLLQTGRMPQVLVNCPCGQGRQTTKHFMKECKHFSSQERQGLLSGSPATPTPKTPGSPSMLPRTPGSPRSPAEARAVHAARKWRMKTLLGKYKEAVKKQEYSYGQIGEFEGVSRRVQKSPRPDVIEMGLVKDGGIMGEWRRGRFA